MNTSNFFGKPTRKHRFSPFNISNRVRECKVNSRTHLSKDFKPFEVNRLKRLIRCSLNQSLARSSFKKTCDDVSVIDKWFKCVFGPGVKEAFVNPAPKSCQSGRKCKMRKPASRRLLLPAEELEMSPEDEWQTVEMFGNTRRFVLPQMFDSGRPDQIESAIFADNFSSVSLQRSFSTRTAFEIGVSCSSRTLVASNFSDGVKSTTVFFTEDRTDGAEFLAAASGVAGSSDAGKKIEDYFESTRSGNRNVVQGATLSSLFLTSKHDGESHSPNLINRLDEKGGESEQFIFNGIKGTSCRLDLIDRTSNCRPAFKNSIRSGSKCRGNPSGSKQNTAKVDLLRKEFKKYCMVDSTKNSSKTNAKISNLWKNSRKVCSTSFSNASEQTVSKATNGPPQRGEEKRLCGSCCVLSAPERQLRVDQQRKVNPGTFKVWNDPVNRSDTNQWFDRLLTEKPREGSPCGESNAVGEQTAKNCPMGDAVGRSVDSNGLEGSETWTSCKTITKQPDKKTRAVEASTTPVKMCNSDCRAGHTSNKELLYTIDVKTKVGTYNRKVQSPKKKYRRSLTRFKPNRNPGRMNLKRRSSTIPHSLKTSVNITIVDDCGKSIDFVDEGYTRNDVELVRFANKASFHDSNSECKVSTVNDDGSCADNSTSLLDSNDKSKKSAETFANAPAENRVEFKRSADERTNSFYPGKASQTEVPADDESTRLTDAGSNCAKVCSRCGQPDKSEKYSEQATSTPDQRWICSGTQTDRQWIGLADAEQRPPMTEQSASISLDLAWPLLATKSFSLLSVNEGIFRTSRSLGSITSSLSLLAKKNRENQISRRLKTRENLNLNDVFLIDDSDSNSDESDMRLYRDIHQFLCYSRLANLDIKKTSKMNNCNSMKRGRSSFLTVITKYRHSKLSSRVKSFRSSFFKDLKKM